MKVRKGFLSFAAKKRMSQGLKGTNLPAGRQGRKCFALFLVPGDFVYCIPKMGKNNCCKKSF
jgi:hypothetical protein